MSWNFCPWCGHRIYQHSKHGCQHTDDVLKTCTDPDCKPGVLVTEGGSHGHVVPQRCDCTVHHSVLRKEGTCA